MGDSQPVTLQTVSYSLPKVRAFLTDATLPVSNLYCENNSKQNFGGWLLGSDLTEEFCSLILVSGNVVNTALVSMTAHVSPVTQQWNGKNWVLLSIVMTWKVDSGIVGGRVPAGFKKHSYCKKKKTPCYSLEINISLSPKYGQPSGL